MQPLTKAQSTKLLGALQHARNDLESNKTILEWKGFMRLPIHKQQAIRHEWNEYYKAIQDSVICHLFRAQREASRRNDLATVKDLGKQAGQMRRDGTHITTQKPLSTDPFDFDNGETVRAYKNLDKKIQTLANMPENKNEVDEIFG